MSVICIHYIYRCASLLLCGKLSVAP